MYAHVVARAVVMIAAAVAIVAAVVGTHQLAHMPLSLLFATLSTITTAASACTTRYCYNKSSTRCYSANENTYDSGSGSINTTIGHSAIRT
jgi:hypothetical protein